MRMIKNVRSYITRIITRDAVAIEESSELYSNVVIVILMSCTATKNLLVLSCGCS